MNQSLLILADFVPSNYSNVQTIGLQEIELEKLFITSSELSEPKIFLYISSDIEKIFKTITEKLRVIKAAGGLVKNGHGEFLFIYRLGKWDLPKGKLEENEKSKIGAQREVEEECGITVDYLGQKIHTSYHTYYMRGKFVLKQTNWYEMGVNKTPKLIPQTEEDIELAEWVPISDLKKIKENTYNLIMDIIEPLL